MTKIIRLPQVVERTGISRSLIYRLIKEGNFPEQIHTSKRTSGWLESEVNEWVQSRRDDSRSSKEESWKQRNIGNNENR